MFIKTGDLQEVNILEIDDVDADQVAQKLKELKKNMKNDNQTENKDEPCS